jgi:hypothetical protein
MVIYPINIPPSMDDSHPTLVTKLTSISIISTTYDPSNFRLGWKADIPLWIPRWLFRVERWQELTVVTANGNTKYETLEVFYGPVGYIMKWLFGSKMMDGVTAMAEALRKRAEEGI